MKTKFVVWAAAVVFAGPLQAHHSVGVFDTATPILVKGIIAEVHFANPHSEIFVDVVDAYGQLLEGLIAVGATGPVFTAEHPQTHDRVIIKRLEEERKTASGIVIPDTAAEKPDQGEVLAVGPGKKNEDGKLVPVDVKVGDKVLYGKYSGTTVRVEGDEILVMREEDIMAVVN